MMSAVLSNPSHPEYGVATIPFPIPRDQYTYCMDLLEALEIGDAVKADCKVEKIDSFYTVLKRAEMLTVNVEELNYLAKRLESFDTGEAAQFQAMAHKLELFELKDLINLTFCCQHCLKIFVIVRFSLRCFLLHGKRFPQGWRPSVRRAKYSSAAPAPVSAGPSRRQNNR